MAAARALAMLGLALTWTVGPALADGPQDRDLWVYARGGVAFGDAVLIEDDALETSFGAAPTVAISLHYRVSRFGFGLVIEGLGGGTFRGLDRERAIGGHLRIAPSVRWRYVDRPWGALYLQVAPGYGLFAHSDAVRFRAGSLVGKDLEEIPTVSHGFTIGFELGLLIYVADDWAANLAMDVVLGTGEMSERDNLTYTRVRALVGLGLEWGL